MTAGAIRFGKLLKKDLESYKVFMAIFVLGIIAWDIFLWTRIGKWRPDMIVGLTFLPLLLIAFWALLSPFLKLRQEWDGNHVHLILVLPVPGFYITGAKALATLIEAIILSLIATAGIWYVGILALNPSVSWVVRQMTTADVVGFAFQALLMFWLALCAAIVVVQFAYLSGRLYEKFSGLIAIWTLFLSTWVVEQLGALAEPAFRWLPDFGFKTWQTINDQLITSVVPVSSAPIASVLLGVLILFAAGSWMLDRQIEI